MKRLSALLVFCLSGCAALPAMPERLKSAIPPIGRPATISLQTKSYAWPRPLLRDAVIDAVHRADMTVLSVERNRDEDHVIFGMTTENLMTANIASLSADESVIEVTARTQHMPPPEETALFFRHLNDELGLR